MKAVVVVVPLGRAPMVMVKAAMEVRCCRAMTVMVVCDRGSRTPKRISSDTGNTDRRM